MYMYMYMLSYSLSLITGSHFFFIKIDGGRLTILYASWHL